MRIAFPASPGRYLSLAMLDMASNNFSCMSTRDVGDAGAEWVLVGPDWRGDLPADTTVVRAPTRDVLLFGRTLVNDEADLPAARAVQHGLAVRPLQAAARIDALQRSNDTGEDFVALVRETLKRNPPLAHEQGKVGVLTRVGLLGTTPGSMTPRLWAQSIPVFLDRLREFGKRINAPVDHWVYAPTNMGDFGTAYTLRAAVGLVGFLALPRREAFYMSTEFDAADQPLHGDHIYRFDLPRDGVPAHAFWSLTMYEKMPNGQRFLAANILNRYTFTDRNEASLRAHGGRTSVWMSRQAPPPGHESNWLPAPSGPFRLSLRAYHPSAELLGGSFRLEPVRRFDSFEASFLPEAA